MRVTTICVATVPWRSLDTWSSRKLDRVRGGVKLAGVAPTNRRTADVIDRRPRPRSPTRPLPRAPCHWSKQRPPRNPCPRTVQGFPQGYDGAAHGRDAVRVKLFSCLTKSFGNTKAFYKPFGIRNDIVTDTITQTHFPKCLSLLVNNSLNSRQSFRTNKGEHTPIYGKHCYWEGKWGEKPAVWTGIIVEMAIFSSE